MRLVLRKGIAMNMRRRQGFWKVGLQGWKLVSENPPNGEVDVRAPNIRTILWGHLFRIFLQQCVETPESLIHIYLPLAWTVSRMRTSLSRHSNEQGSSDAAPCTPEDHMSRAPGYMPASRRSQYLGLQALEAQTVGLANCLRVGHSS
jgi:hypothetical protein